MADQEPAAKYETPPTTVRYDGVFDFDGMYQDIIAYLRRHNYLFYEDLYKHKPWSPVGTELTLGWHADRELDEYYYYTIKFDWHIMDLHQVEAIRDGKKVTLSKAYFWVNISGVASADWQALENSGGTFTRTLGKFFRTKVADREFLYDYIYPIFGEIMELQQIIQNWTNMEASRVEKAA